MHGVLNAVIVATIFLFSSSVSALNVNVQGTAKNASSAALSGAVATLVKAGFSAVTNAQGTFAITGIIPDQAVRFPGHGQNGGFVRPVFNGALLTFSIPASSPKVKIEVYDMKGARVVTVLNQRLLQGDYSFSPLTMVRPLVTSMIYLVHVQIDGNNTTFVAPYISSGLRVSLGAARAAGSLQIAKVSTASVDTLEVTLCGYVLRRMPVESYTQSGIAVTLTQTLLSSAGQKAVDSLFDALRNQIKSLDSLDSADQVKSKDFASIRDGFNRILTSEDSYNMKATIGYMVSSLLALNTNASVWKMVDSLDSYFNQSDSAVSLSKTGLMKKTLAKSGVVGLGKSVAAASLQNLAKMAQKPVFPKFITTSYIQNIAENDVLPILDNLVASCKRMESCGDRSLELTIEGDTFNIDKGEIFMLEASIHLLRATLNSFCLYEMDLYARGTTTLSWIDTLSDMDSRDFVRYTISGDTLYKNSRSNVSMSTFMFNTIKYNMERPGFLSIRKNNFARVKADLLAVPATIKAGITYIRAETGDQSKNIIKISDITNADNDLADVPGRMTDHGVSATLANKFKTPETIADFITELLSGPYTLNETIDSTSINIKVNVTAMLDNPVADLRTLLPKYQWLPANEWNNWNSDQWVNEYFSDNFSFTSSDSIAIAGTLIDSIVPDPWYSDGKICYLNTLFNHSAEIDSTVTVLPFTLIDDASARIKSADIDSLVKAKTFFPYFNDYTFGGLFPEMNRQKWIDMIY